MRDILFKAKRIDNGEWVQGNLFVEGNRVEITRGTCNGIGIEGVTVDKNTICQFTGLTDKNGNKIWENDILVDDICSVVRWDEEEARFVIDDYGTKGCLMEYGFDEDAGEYGVVDTCGFNDFYTMKAFEVIGNIFDNPELLKGE